MSVGPKIMRDRRIEKAIEMAEWIIEVLDLAAISPRPSEDIAACERGAQLLARVLWEAEFYALLEEGRPTQGQQKAALIQRQKAKGGAR